MTSSRARLPLRRARRIHKEKAQSQVMAAIRSRGNKDTELKLAAIFRAARITGWRRHQPLPGRPDFVFRRARLAVFVDGCFWHGCPKHGRKPSSNRGYWLPKLRRNQERDAAVVPRLARAGWTVIRLWEHELAKPAQSQHRITRALARLQKPRNEVNSHSHEFCRPGTLRRRWWSGPRSRDGWLPPRCRCRV